MCSSLKNTLTELVLIDVLNEKKNYKLHRSIHMIRHVTKLKFDKSNMNNTVMKTLQKN